MGKKKSKISKKKQAKAISISTRKRKHASATAAFGVPVTKGGIATSSSSSSNTNMVNKTLNRKKRAPLASKIKMSSTTTSTHNSSQRSEEQKNFDQEYASLQERHFNNQSKKRDNKKKSKNKSSLNFQAATLELDKPKTAQDLMNDTVSQFSSGLSGIGATHCIVPNNSLVDQTSSGASSLQKRAEQGRVVQPEAWTTDDKANTNTENSFWALANDSDDSDGDHNKVQKKPAAPAFNFAPASFSFTSTLPTTQTVGTFNRGAMNNNTQWNGGIEDDDPDL